MKNGSTATIAAIATPPGPGGIAILRLSGPAARTVLAALFRPSRPAGFAFKARHLHHGHALDADGEILDEVLAVHMPGPASATGEDVAEIHCHGGPGVTAALLEAALAAGARPARPGEFTRRAFLNGRMDLTQAEAVAELTSAPTRQGARLARAKLDGLLGRRIADLRAGLDSLRVQVAAAVDFPDEDLELLPRDALAQGVAEALEAVGHLLEAFARARLWREGALAVLAGRVNAGKSSLLNALVGRSRAIVSPLPGTTRDFIEESINLDGLVIRLADTAGLREAHDPVEEEGIRLSHSLAAEADLILLVVDVNTGLSDEERRFLAHHREAVDQGRALVILNKVDTRPEATWPDTLEGCPAFPLSAVTGAGLAAFSAALRAAALAGRQEESATDVAPNLRQSQLLRQTQEELAALATDIAAGFPVDILGVRLDAAASLLDEVTGASSGEEILDRIFSSFCIGK